jgi:hypothetical protein
MKGKKTGGRQKGSLNRTTEEVRKSLLRLLDDNLTNLQKDIQGLKGKDRATLLISLAKHCTPPAMNPEKLSEEQLQQIIEYLKKQHNEQTISKK